MFIYQCVVVKKDIDLCSKKKTIGEPDQLIVVILGRSAVPKYIYRVFDDCLKALNSATMVFDTLEERILPKAIKSVVACRIR
jgi:hypothetical protein